MGFVLLVVGGISLLVFLADKRDLLLGAVAVSSAANGVVMLAIAAALKSLIRLESSR